MKLIIMKIAHEQVGDWGESEGELTSCYINARWNSVVCHLSNVHKISMNTASLNSRGALGNIIYIQL